jgi:hypothetical protein
MSVIYSDDFSGSSDGTLLTTHNPAWTETASSGGHGTIRSGVCYDPGAHFTLNVLTGIVPPSADYAVEAVFARKANLTRNIYLCVRCSADGNTHYAFYHQRSGSAILRKTIDGSSTTLGEVVRNIPENGSETWRIAIEGTRILCSIDGATIFDVDDTAISSGLVGLHFYTYPYDSTVDGPVVDSFKVETLDEPVNHIVTIAGVRRPRTGAVVAGIVPLRAVDFKATVGADVIDTFLNTLEFADTHTINGIQMPAVVDSPVFTERQARSQKDYADGIYTDRKVVYVSAAAFGVRPALGEQLMLDGARFIVTECTDEMGMYAITVEASEF